MRLRKSDSQASSSAFRCALASLADADAFIGRVLVCTKVANQMHRRIPRRYPTRNLLSWNVTVRPYIKRLLSFDASVWGNIGECYIGISGFRSADRFRFLLLSASAVDELPSCGTRSSAPSSASSATTHTSLPPSGSITGLNPTDKDACTP